MGIICISVTVEVVWVDDTVKGEVGKRWKIWGILLRREKKEKLEPTKETEKTHIKGKPKWYDIIEVKEEIAGVRDGNQHWIWRKN